MNSPGIGKNSLTVGATSSGETRLTATGADGGYAGDTNGYADVDTVAVFSSYGFTRDGRIKPEVVAPGDAVSIPVLLPMSRTCLTTSDVCSPVLSRQHPVVGPYVGEVSTQVAGIPLLHNVGVRNSMRTR